MKAKLWTIDNDDTRSVKNAEILQDFLNEEASLKFDWVFVTFTTPGAVTNLKVPHGANYVPLDIVSTRNEGGITFNYSLFDKNFLDVTTAGAATFRGLIGRYRENQE